MLEKALDRLVDGGQTKQALDALEADNLGEGLRLALLAYPYATEAGAAALRGAVEAQAQLTTSAGSSDDDDRLTSVELALARMNDKDAADVQARALSQIPEEYLTISGRAAAGLRG
jgi:hypothetical protein